MNYFIIQNDEFKKVDSIAYENWMEDESRKYILPEYYELVEGRKQGLETMYQGAVDDGEGLYPFVLLIFDDNPELTENENEPEIEYFERFDQLEKRYNEVINDLQKKIMAE